MLASVMLTRKTQFTFVVGSRRASTVTGGDDPDTPRP